MQAAPLPANEILEFFCGVGGDIRHFVFDIVLLMSSPLLVKQVGYGMKLSRSISRDV